MAKLPKFFRDAKHSRRAWRKTVAEVALCVAFLLMFISMYVNGDVNETFEIYMFFFAGVAYGVGCAYLYENKKRQ